MLLSEDHTVCYTWLWHTALRFLLTFMYHIINTFFLNKKYVDICGK